MSTSISQATSLNAEAELRDGYLAAHSFFHSFKEPILLTFDLNEKYEPPLLPLNIASSMFKLRVSAIYYRDYAKLE